MVFGIFSSLTYFYKPIKSKVDNIILCNMKQIIIMLLSILTFSCTHEREEVKVVDVNSPASINTEVPSFFYTSESKVGLSWIETEGTKKSLKYAVYKSKKWSVTKTIISDNKLLANWSDFPGIATNGNNWLAWFLKMNNSETFAYNIMITQSLDEGESWSIPQRLHSDTALTEHGFVSTMPADNGFQLIWLDGRNATNSSGNFSIRTAFVDFEGNISNRQILDDNVCTCCQTSMVSTGQNNFIAVYRNRSDNEIRDISTVRFSDIGHAKEPKIMYDDQWHIPGCPVNGPRAISNGNEIGVVWFTMDKNGVAKVQFATSDNNGETYSSPLLIDENNLGRVDILAVDGAFYISYMDEAKSGVEIKIAKVRANKLVNQYSIVKVSPSRKSGFPRMVYSENESGIFIAYTDVKLKKLMLKFIKI